MVLNNFRKDAEALMEKEGYGPSEIARDLEIAPQSVRNYFLKAKLTEGYIKLCDYLGYDIKITYIKQKR